MNEKVEIGKGKYINKNANIIGLFAGSFPRELALEWEEDCKKRYNGCRWIKMWSDHLVAKTVQEKQTFIIEKEPEPKEEKKESDEIPTIGKKLKESE